MKNTKKNAMVIGYSTIALNAISSTVLTRIYLSCLGYHIYGIYQMVFAIAQYILLFDFGITATVTRFRVEYKEKGEREKGENLLFHCAVVLIFLAVFITVLGAVVGTNVGKIYQSLTADEVYLAQKMMAFMVAQIVLTLGEHFFHGIANSEEKYTVVKGIAFAKSTLRLVLIVSALSFGSGVMGIVYVDFMLAVVCLLIMTLYDSKYIKFRVKYHGVDKQMLKSIFFLMLALMLQSVATYANNAASKTVLGIMLDAKKVAVYAIAVTINSFFASIPNSMHSMYVPRAMQMVVAKATGEDLTDLVIRPGRIQFMFCGAVVAGFVLFGRSFIHLWVGAEADAAWAAALLLIVPHLFPLIQNVCLSILTAMNKRLVRSLIVAFTSVINIATALLLVRPLGILGPAIGTCISVTLGNIIASNIYYHKKIGLNVPRMFREIFNRTLPCILLASLVSWPTLWLPFTGWLKFAMNCTAFILAYGVLLWLYGANEYEKRLACTFLHIKKRNRRPAK